MHRVEYQGVEKHGIPLKEVVNLMNSCLKYTRGISNALLAVVVFVLTVSDVRAAGREAALDVRSGKGFARLVFSFDRLPKYSTKSVSTVFILKFREPVRVDLQPVALKIGQYVTIARRDPDGYGLRFAMSRDYKVNVMRAGNYLIVDFLSKGWKGRLPGIPRDIVEKLAREAEKARLAAAERARQEALQRDPLFVEVHEARQPTFNRISFHWNRFVTARTTRDGDVVTILFGGHARPDLAHLKINPPENLKAVHYELNKNSLKIVMQVTRGTRVRAFREGNNYVVDLTLARPRRMTSLERKLYNAQKQLPDTVQKRSEEIILPSIDTKVEIRKKNGRFPMARPEIRPGQKRNTFPPLPVRSIRKTVRKQQQRKSVVSVTKLNADPGNQKKHHTKTAAEVLSKPLPNLATGGREQKEAVTVSRKTPLGKQGQGEAVTRGSFDPVSQPASQPVHKKAEVGNGRDISHSGRIVVTRNENSVQLQFPFLKKEVPAAIFQRNDVLRILFDSTEKMDITDLQPKLGGIVNSIRHQRLDRSQMFEFHLSGPWLTSVSRQNKLWNISIGDLVTGSSTKIIPYKKTGKSGLEEVFIPLSGAGRMHQIRDSDSGDDLLVFTTVGPARNIRKVHEHVEFQLFRTIHGVVVRPLADDLRIGRKHQEIVIGGQGGLKLSGGSAAAGMQRSKPLNKRRTLARKLKFNDPQTRTIDGFVRRTLELERAIASRRGRPRRRARMELARHWLSRGFAPEGLGMLDILASENVELTTDPVFRLLRGMARVMLRRYKEAREDLGSNDLEDNPHASLWRGFSDYRQRKFKHALTEFKRGEPVIGNYLARRQAAFRLAEADVAIEQGNPLLAGIALDKMPETGSTPMQVAMSMFLEGRIMELQNRTREALQLYADATAANIRPVTARAVYHLTDLRLRTGNIKTATGVDILERLSIVWRGDEVELQVLHRLADLYIEKGRYDDAFKLMKTAVQAYPRAELALSLQDRMKTKFEELFLHDKASELPPVKALALFYDHKYLTPPGRLGDEMIRRLADRLIDVDLLDKAVELLEHQVNRRLKGAGRAQVAIRLAMVHLLQHHPRRALKTLLRTRQPRLPHQVRQARRLLEARAYAELGRSGPAIELLAEDESKDAGEIRALALWNARKWAKAGEEYEKLLANRWQQPGALSGKEQVQVLRAAISYALGSDQTGVERLREKYAKKMAGGADAEAFAMITDPVKSGARTIDRLARDIADIDTVEAFVKAFRQRLGRTGGPRTTSAVK